MKTKFGSIVVGGSGKLGGTSLQRNTGGYSMRVNSFKPKVRSNIFYVRNSYFRVISQSYRSLSAAQLAWLESASKKFPIHKPDGSVYFANSFEFYVAMSVYNYFALGYPLSTFSLNNYLPKAHVFSLSVVASPFSMSLSFTLSPLAFGYTFFYFTRPLKPSVTPIDSDFAYLVSYSGGVTSPRSLTSAYQSRFPNLVYSGYVIHARAYFWYRTNPFLKPQAQFSAIIS